MVVIRFRDDSEHEELLKKVKKMKKFTEELQDCLEEAMEDDGYDYDFRGSYRKDPEEGNMRMKGGRFRYRGGM